MHIQFFYFDYGMVEDSSGLLLTHCILNQKLTTWGNVKLPTKSSYCGSGSDQFPQHCLFSIVDQMKSELSVNIIIVLSICQQGDQTLFDVNGADIVLSQSLHQQQWLQAAFLSELPK